MVPLGWSASASAATSAALVSVRGSGPVDVLYAGSLVDLMTKEVGPGFDKATGHKFVGYSAGSDALASDIKAKTQVADVFVSAGPSANASLEGAKNGNWVSWYVAFATSNLVIGYNPGSKFAAQLKSKPWYQVVTERGFRLGRTDPATDPKGVLAVQALDAAAAREHKPALRSLGSEESNVFPEETLVGRLQAGQLDAGFFYAAEAVAANIKTIPLVGEHRSATYTVTVVNRAPHVAGGVAFVRYLLSGAGRRALGKDGFNEINPPEVTGTGVPVQLESLLRSSQRRPASGR